MDIDAYNHIRSSGSGFYEQKRGLIAVWGKEAVQFLDGMITNDMKTLEDGQQMPAAFPNPQGRLIAVVRILRQGDRFLIETEEATREKLFQNLFRFTFAGDFFVEDLSDLFSSFSLFRQEGSKLPGYIPSENGFRIEYKGESLFAFKGIRNEGVDIFLPQTQLQEYFLEDSGAVPLFSDELYETLRIESGIPKFGIDMDETTIVPELGFPEMISYTKGCYVGQEIIARIHFRGHVAKQLTGLTSENPLQAGNELVSSDGKPAGRITSATISPKLERPIALAFVRYDYLSPGTELISGDHTIVVTRLPFIE